MSKRGLGRLRRPRYDVVFYMPWMGPLLAPGKTLPTGGAETQVYLLAQSLAATGLRVCVVAFQTPEGLPERAGLVDVHARRPYTGHKRAVGKITETFATWWALGRLRTPVVVNRASGPYVGIVAVFALLFRRRFVFSSAHVGDFTFTLGENGRNLAIYKLGVRLADTVVVQTREQIELCRNVFRRDPVLIRSIAPPAPPAPRSANAFLWVGRAASYKQPLKLLELARRVPEARFWMIVVPEPYPWSAKLTEEIEREAESVPNVELLAPRPRDQVLELMDRAVATVNTADEEGLSNIFLEGWVRGVPALTLTHDPDAIVSRNGIGYFAEGSMERFAEHARELWAGRENMEEIAERCRRYVQENHSPEVVLGRWRDVIAGTARPEPVPEAPAAAAPELTEVA